MLGRKQRLENHRRIGCRPDRHLDSDAADLIEATAKAGKAILCEKPIDFDICQVKSCRDAIASSGVPIQLGFNRHFDPGHRAARDAVRRGDIGTLEQVVITSRDPAPPPRAYLEASGGIFRDMTIRDFDIGGAPRQHRTDSLSAAFRNLGRDAQEDISPALRGAVHPLRHDRDAQQRRHRAR